MMGTLLSAGLAGLAYVKKESVEAISQWLAKHFPFVIRWLKKTFCLLRNYHLLSGVVSLLSLVWDWYRILTNQRTTETEKLYTLIFKTLSAGFTITAYLFCFLAAGAATSPAIILFVLSAATKLIEGAWQAWKSHDGPKPVPPGDVNWREQAEYQRAKNFQARQKSSAWIKICASLLTTISVSVFYAFHLSFAVSVCFILSNILLGLTEESILSNIDEKADRTLQAAIRSIDSLMTPTLKGSHEGNEATFTTRLQQFHAWRATMESEVQLLQQKRETLESEQKKLLKAQQELVRREDVCRQAEQEIERAKTLINEMRAFCTRVNNTCPSPNPSERSDTDGNQRAIEVYPAPSNVFSSRFFHERSITAPLTLTNNIDGHSSQITNVANEALPSSDTECAA